MQNEVIQSSKSKIKKEQINPKKEISIINPLLSNQSEMTKHRSQELLSQHSPKNTSNTSNPTSSNNSKKNTFLGNSIKQIANYSGVKNKNMKKSCNLNSQLNEIKKYNNTQNEEKEKIIRSEKSIIYYNDDKFEIDRNNGKNKINNKNININTQKNENDKNIEKIKNIKKNALDNILYESDSFHDIDSMEEDIHSKGNKIKSANTNIDMKLNNINNINFEDDNKKKSNKAVNKNYIKNKTTNLKNKKELKESKNNKEIKENKQNEQENKKKEINNELNNQDDLYDELMTKENEFDNPKNIQINNIQNKRFPALSINPFAVKSKHLDKIDKNNERKPSSSKNVYEKIIINHHIKSSTFGTNNKSSTTNPNSSNLSGIVDILNINNNSSSKKENNNICNSNSDIDKNYRNLLLLAKSGDRPKFLELFNKINTLPKDLLDLNYHDENGNTALHYSSDEGNLKIVEILLNANCDTNIKNNEKETPLLLASKRGYFDISKKLIEHGALINIYNSEKNTPFHYACMHNYEELVKYFLTKSPQIKVKNIYGKTPIDLTTNKEIKDLIKQYLNVNEKKFISDSNLIDLSKKNKNFDNKSLNRSNHSPLKNSGNINIIDIDKNKFNKNKSSISPLIKSPRNPMNNNKKGEFNSIPEPFDINIKKTHTLTKNLILKESSSINLENIKNKELNTFNIKNSQNKIINKTNTNSIFKKNELKNSKKIKEKDNIKNPIINYNDKNKNESNINKNKNNCLINGLKKTKTVEMFNSSLVDNKDKINKTNLYNSLRKGYIALNESRMNNSNIYDNENNHYRMNLSINSTHHEKIEKKKSKNKSVNKEIKEMNITRNNNIKKKSKFYDNKKKLLLDSIDLSNKNLIHLNKTDENIKNIPKNKKNTLKKQVSINNKDSNKNIAKIVDTEKIITRSKANTMYRKGNQSKTKKNDNSIINNCNISKISCNQNKNNIMFDKINKSNIIDQTLADNMNNKLNLNSIEEEKISPSNFVCLAQLGKGSFGEVYLVQKINTKEKFAMKVLRKERVMGQNLLKYAIAERNVLSLSHHPFIVKLNYAFQTSTKLFLVLEYCPNGDLSKHLLIEKRFSEQRAKFYLCEILLALEDLHKRNIIFRDLKPDNVVLDEQGHCKLTDFGLSKEGVIENAYAQSFCGSIAYLAPEMLKKKGHGKAVDWYLLGVLFYEMLVGITPFFTTKKEEIFHNIEFGELKIPDFVSTEAAGLLRELLEKNPNKRLGGGPKDAQEIKQHPYFKDVDWDKVYNKKLKPPIFMNYMNKMVHLFHRPRLFANDDLLNNNSDKSNSNILKNWSFINNEEM